MIKPGPYWHVVRFQEHPLCPANAPPDIPKIIKSGISDDGPDHPNCPPISAADGAVTLLHKLGRDDWLEKFLDWKGTEHFNISMKHSVWSLLYIERHFRTVEIGYLCELERTPGVVFLIQDNGDWKPHSTIDRGQYSENEGWVRAQSRALARSIWFQERWAGEEIREVSWSGMTADERKARDAFRKEFTEKYADSTEASDDDYDDEKEEACEMAERERIWRECRAGCGAQDCKLACSKCKDFRYCSPKCQKEDWKYHKSICGKDISDDEE